MLFTSYPGMVGEKWVVEGYDLTDVPFMWYANDPADRRVYAVTVYAFVPDDVQAVGILVGGTQDRYGITLEVQVQQVQCSEYGGMLRPDRRTTSM